MAVGSLLVARELRAALDDGAAGVGRVVARIAGKHAPEQQDNLSGVSGNLLPGRYTSRNLLETAEGFDADSDCGRGRTEQGHLQKSLKRSGAISVYLTVC
jgi:hypothetical protein